MAPRVAVVDDDGPFRDMMRDLLEAEGYDVLLLHRTVQAIAALHAFGPDAIILDLWMERPGSGWDLLESIKGDPALQSTPVIVCSADAPALRRREALLLRHGCAQLLKPFHIADLLDLLRRLIGLPDAASALEDPVRPISLQEA